MKIERLQGDYVLLRSDTLRLLVPQSGMAEIVHLQNRVAASEKCLADVAQLSEFMVDDHADGNAEKTDNQEAKNNLHFVSLSDHLTLQNHVPNNRFVVTTHNETPDLRWCWSEVHLFNHADMLVSPLPPLLCTDITPLQAVITLDKDVQAFYCDFKHILRYLTHLQKH